MAVLIQVDQFLDVLRRSGLLEPGRLQSYLDSLGTTSAVPATARELALAMVRDGLLTRFQANQLLLGKHRGFLVGGKYRLLEHLGAGGMGNVFLCEHISMRRRVAIKMLPQHRAQGSSYLERFYREARAVAALDHPNIVRAHDIDCEGNLHFLVMEYVDGSSLHDIVSRHGPLSIERAAHYISQAAEGLEHAHEAGIVHRDIKPGNILVDRNGTVKILDMGLARFFHEDDNLSKKHDETVLGTSDYLAPEQSRDSDVDIRADIYSLGATFYFVLTGRTLFGEGTTTQKLVWHQTRQPKPIRTFRPDIPEELAGVIEKRMLAKDPEQRFSTPIQICSALVPWTSTPVEPPPEKEMPRHCPAASREVPSGVRRGPGETLTPRTPRLARKAWAAAPATLPPAPRHSAESAVQSTASTPTETAHTMVAQSEAPETVIRIEQPDSDAEPPPRGKRAIGRLSLLITFVGLGLLIAWGLLTRPWNRENRPSPVPREERGGHVLPAPQQAGAIRVFAGHSQPVNQVALSPDDRLAASASFDGTVRVWEVASGKEIQRFEGHQGAVWGVAFSPDGSEVLSSGTDRTIRLWSRATGKELLRLESDEACVSVVFTPEGQHILAASNDHTIRLWDLKSRQQIRSYRGHTGPVVRVALLPGGKRFVSCSHDRTIRVWDIEKEQEQLNFEWHTDKVLGVAVSSDGTLGVSGSLDRTLRLFDIRTGSEIRPLSGPTDQVWQVLFTPDGKRILSAGSDNRIRLWDVATGRQLLSFEGHEGLIVGLAVSHDGQHVLSGSWDRTVRLWKLPE